jgi:hypothetical protein
MPFKSKAQMRKFFAMERAGELPQGTAREWAHHTSDIKKLPEKIEEKTKEGFDLNTVMTNLGSAAVESELVEKLASHTQITKDLVVSLAKRVDMTPTDFVKLAYANPADYVMFLKIASGAVKPTPRLIKQAGLTGGSSLLKRILGKAQSAYSASRGRGDVTGRGSGYFGRSEPVNGNAIDRVLAGARFGGSRAGRNAEAVVGGTSLVGAGAGLGSMALSGDSAGPASLAAPDSTMDTAKGISAATNGPAANPAPAKPGEGSPSAAPSSSSSGMSPAGMALLAAGGVGAGALGAHALSGKKKKKEVYAKDMVYDLVRAVAIKKAATLYKQAAANQFCSYLDTVVVQMPLEKAAAVRKLQATVSEGKPLSYAIKVAYPHLSGEQRGLLAATLVKYASKKGMEDQKPFFAGKISGRKETTVKMKDSAKTLKEMS